MNKNQLLLKKILALNLLCLYIAHIPTLQAKESYTMQEQFVWEKYSNFPPLIVYTLGFLYAAPSLLDIKTKTKDYSSEDFKHFLKALTIYYPDAKNTKKDELHKLSQKLKLPILKIYASSLNQNPTNVYFLFIQAKKIGSCIIYIYNEEKRKTDFEDLYVNIPGFGNSYMHKNIPSNKSLQAFIENIKALKQTEESILLFGYAKNNVVKSPQDIAKFGFDIQAHHPSYKERYEFLEILLTKQHPDIKVDTLAKKTIGFTYTLLLELVDLAQLYKKRARHQHITNEQLEKAYQTMLAQHKPINTHEFINVERTSIHEIGHAFIACHFKEHFKLHQVSTTPYKIVNTSHFLGPQEFIETGRAYITKLHDNVHKIKIDQEHIMIYLAGKISEQIYFGLPNKQELTATNGYQAFITNPHGATTDLQEAQKLAKNISTDSEDLLQELYKNTLNILMENKALLKALAQYLQEEETLSGTQVYEFLKKYNQ